jgi:hypothetical protein
MGIGSGLFVILYPLFLGKKDFFLLLSSMPFINFMSTPLSQPRWFPAEVTVVAEQL